MEKFIGSWELLRMMANGRILVDNEDRTSQNVAILYEFKEGGECAMHRMGNTAHGTWGIGSPNLISMNFLEAGGSFTGEYWFDVNKLIMKGHVGNDEMHFVLKDKMKL